MDKRIVEGIKLLFVYALVFVFTCGVTYLRNKNEIVEEVYVEPPVKIEVVVEEPEQEPVKVLYRVTAYCACEECCGEWANKRPLDENGEPIVVGAWGVELVDNFSAASPMAFGTQVELDGIGTVEIQDRTAQWVVDRFGEDVIDIYMNDHITASEFGVQYIEGVIK